MFAPSVFSPSVFPPSVFPPSGAALIPGLLLGDLLMSSLVGAVNYTVQGALAVSVDIQAADDGDIQVIVIDDDVEAS